MTDTCPRAESTAGPWNDSGANLQHPQTHALTVTSAEEYDDLCSYAHLAPKPLLLIDREGRRWRCRTDVHRDLYGSVEAPLRGALDLTRDLPGASRTRPRLLRRRRPLRIAARPARSSLSFGRCVTGCNSHRRGTVALSAGVSRALPAYPVAWPR